MIVATKDVHIYSASWGPDDDGRTVDGPGPLTRCPAMCKSLTNGGESKYSAKLLHKLLCKSNVGSLCAPCKASVLVSFLRTLWNGTYD